MQLQLEQLDIQPGQRILLRNLRWDQFEQILDELGSERSSRIAYYKRTLEIMVPLPEHENGKENIGDLVKALLEETDIEFVPFGSTTFKRQNMDSGVEPDECFYITHEAAMRGAARINLNFDPPPDLAIEIDITTSSEIKKRSYQALGVPELWIYDGRKLEINVLGDGKYVKSTFSPTFPNFSIVEVIPRYVAMSQVDGRNTAIKAFRAWVRTQLP